jgi:dienelactone hydrolase
MTLRMRRLRPLFSCTTPFLHMGFPLLCLIIWGLTHSFSCLASAATYESSYNPLNVDQNQSIIPQDMDVEDLARNRIIPLRVYLPYEKKNSPVIVFSHGLGGNKEGSRFLGTHWALRGYVVVFIQHRGSDDTLWKGKKPLEGFLNLKRGANSENFVLRVGDIPKVLDQLHAWNTIQGHGLFKRMDLQNIGMSGHSFGAATTQAVSGQSGIHGVAKHTEARIQAALMMSPSLPKEASAAQAFGRVSLPWMLMTGTQDTSPLGLTDVSQRLSVFPALPAGGKYELILDGAQHSAFGDYDGPQGQKIIRNPHHHSSILALSTAFWDSFLRKDPYARKWLESSKVRDALQEKDVWHYK